MDSLPPEKKKKVVASEYVKIIIICGSNYPLTQNYHSYEQNLNQVDIAIIHNSGWI